MTVQVPPLVTKTVSTEIREYTATLMALHKAYMELGFTPRAKTGRALRPISEKEPSDKFSWPEGMDERYEAAMRELSGALDDEPEVDEDAFDEDPD